MKTNRSPNQVHDPVLAKEVIEFLKIAHSKKYVDATLGAGGHTLEMVKKGAEVLGIDEDEQILKIAASNLKNYQSLVKIIKGNFKDLKKLAWQNGFSRVDGVLYDLGVSSLQLTSSTRGFSFAHEEAPLDMRRNQDSALLKASDLLNLLPKDKLAEVFGVILSKNKSEKLAEKIVTKRKAEAFQKVGDFLRVCEKVLPRGRSKIHPATKAFMALRMAVNTELPDLKASLPQAFELLSSGGRLVVISFHSLEDKIVKEYFGYLIKTKKAKRITKKPLVPTDQEVSSNRRARSAKLRVIEKL